MNLYYQAKGRNPWNCDFKCSALVVITDPSNNYSFLIVIIIIELKLLIDGVLCVHVQVMVIAAMNRQE